MAFVQLSDSDAAINVFSAKQEHITGYAHIADGDPRIAAPERAAAPCHRDDDAPRPAEELADPPMRMHRWATRR